MKELEKKYDDAKVLTRWVLGGEKSTAEYAIEMAYNVCRAVDKSLWKKNSVKTYDADKGRWFVDRRAQRHIYNKWLQMLDKKQYPLEYAYYQAKKYQAKGKIPTPKEYSKALAHLLKAKCSSPELYEAVKKGPAVSKKVDSLFSDAGYNKSRTAEDWAYLLDKHYDMAMLCYENFGSWYASCLSWIGYTYEGVEDEWEREEWYDPFWRSFDDTLYEKGIRCSSSLLTALETLESSEDSPHSRYPEEE